MVRNYLYNNRCRSWRCDYNTSGRILWLWTGTYEPEIDHRKQLSREVGFQDAHASTAELWGIRLSILTLHADCSFLHPIPEVRKAGVLPFHISRPISSKYAQGLWTFRIFFAKPTEVPWFFFCVSSPKKVYENLMMLDPSARLETTAKGRTFADMPFDLLLCCVVSWCSLGSRGRTCQTYKCEKTWIWCVCFLSWCHAQLAGSLSRWIPRTDQKECKQWTKHKTCGLLFAPYPHVLILTETSPKQKNDQGWPKGLVCNLSSSFFLSFFVSFFFFCLSVCLSLSLSFVFLCLPLLVPWDSYIFGHCAPCHRNSDFKTGYFSAFYQTFPPAPFQNDTKQRQNFGL